MALEAQLINDSGPIEVQWTYTNSTGASLTVKDGEVIGIPADSGKRVAAVVRSETDVATPGTIANGEVCQVAISGRVRVPKDTAVSFSQGETCWWDASATTATDSATAGTMSDFVLGRVVNVAATADTTVDVDLNEGPYEGSMGSSSSSSTSSSSSSSSSSSTST